jgi:hypothetical protein
VDTSSVQVLLATSWALSCFARPRGSRCTGSCGSAAVLLCRRLAWRSSAPFGQERSREIS